MELIDEIKERAKANIRTIVLPESMDKRVIEASKKIVEEKLANIIIIGKKDEIRQIDSSFDFNKIEVINPLECPYLEELILKLVDLRKHKNLSYEEAKSFLLNDYMYFACMLVKTGRADGVVSGACHSSSNTLRPALQIIKAREDIGFVSAFFLMCVPNCNYGYRGNFIFADAGLVQDPDEEKLATIAHTSGESFEELTGVKAKIALISHSTKGSAKHALVDKVINAGRIAREKYPQDIIDDELQVDAAIVPEIAKFKAPSSILHGEANVLVFPNLDAGNASYKLVQRLAKAEAYGPICQGINSPINDLSRGASVEDIIGVVAITAVQAQK